ncbi:hypothetical protein [Propionivibrio sp.]|uniref:hypothetical protein n=1 Tax=Propionivibrio sp. TaxID=2212460 RepID=UPI003BF2E3E4
MDQTIINAIIAGSGAAFAFILKIIWEGLRELQKADVELAAQVHAVRLMMADSYIKKDDFERMTSAIFVKLDKIENKLDAKADK